jgi:tRNA A37 threonylcarbamoyladenosine synthetase subunit TsaC/SUA5/YrdC
VILSVSSLRKGGEALEQAVQAWRDGQKIALPTECGYFVTGQGEIWLSAQAPDLPELKAVFETFWPGPLRLRLPLQGSKRIWQIPAHPLAQAFLKLVEQPVAARPGPPETADLVLEWKDPPLALDWSEADCACTPWRWLRSGPVERREFEWVSGQSTILSGEALPGREHEAAPVFREKQSYRIEP